MTQGSLVEQTAWEREYLEHREMARAMLARDFPSIADPDEIYHEAWAEALEMRARGDDVSNLGGLLRTIVWRRACDRVRKAGADPVDPDSGVFAFEVDPEPLPDEQVEVRLHGALVRQVVDSLDERQAAAIKLRFEKQMERKEIGRTLGVTQKRLDKIFNETFREVEQVLTELDDSSEWRRRQRSLLFACETGLASARQRRLATRMVSEDPRCRAMLSEIRATMKGLAALVPAPLLISEVSTGRVARIRFAFLDRMAQVRDTAADWSARLFNHGSAAEQAGAGSAATAAGGAAVKAAVLCVAVTGSAVVCVTNGWLGQSAERPHRTPVARHKKAVRPPAKVKVLPVAKPTAPIRRVARKPTTTQVVKPVAAKPPPSPAPTGSTEFGPDTTGSSSAVSTPAAAPSGGGGEFTP